MNFKELLPLSGVLLLLIACGKKAPHEPPPKPVMAKPSAPNKKSPSLLRGEGGYFVGDEGIVALYWSFPIEVDYSKVLLGNKTVATVRGSTYIYPHPLERGKSYTFRVIGIKGNREVAQVVIEVSPRGD